MITTGINSGKKMKRWVINPNTNTRTRTMFVKENENTPNISVDAYLGLIPAKADLLDNYMKTSNVRTLKRDHRLLTRAYRELVGPEVKYDQNPKIQEVFNGHVTRKIVEVLSRKTGTIGFVEIRLEDCPTLSEMKKDKDIRFGRKCREAYTLVMEEHGLEEKLR